MVVASYQYFGVEQSPSRGSDGVWFSWLERLFYAPLTVPDFNQRSAVTLVILYAARPGYLEAKINGESHERHNAT